MGTYPSGEGYVYLVTKPGYRIGWHGDNYYTYKEKKMTDFRIGDNVRVLVNVAGDIGTIVSGPNDLGFFRVVFDDRGGQGNWIGSSEMELVSERSEPVGEYSEGDILVDQDGDFYKVLGVGNYGVELTDYHHSSETAEGDNEFDEYRGFDEISDWAVAGDVKEVTLEEVAKKFNVSVSGIRIKD